jgi:predicted NUDIX family NTP pyrophosphohydrolase
MKQSAGILVYRRKGKDLEVLLGHPGGPYWAKKDDGAWSIPKGEYEEKEEPFSAAQREFEEEMGSPPPEGKAIDLGAVKRKDGKIIKAWAVEGDFDTDSINSNSFEMEWPPGSGRKQSFPEVDRAAWFGLGAALNKVHSGQDYFLRELAAKLDEAILESNPDKPLEEKSDEQQISLL